MLLRDFLQSPVSPHEFIAQPNFVKSCDYVYRSPFFCKENCNHFGIKGLEECIHEPPNRCAIIMCRFRDGELEKVIYKCSEKTQYRYILVQTLIGDDGFVSLDTLQNLPENIVRIYSKNVHFFHKNLIPIPIGRDWRVTAENFLQTFTRNDLNNYQNLAYMNFSLQTNLEIRTKVYKLFEDKDWVTKRLPVAYTQYELTHSDFVREIHHHKFCFSPVGRALDCYRTWDALFAKSIPIVDKNIHIQNFTDLPLLIVEDWNSVTFEYLCQKFTDMLDRDFAFEKLTVKYWENKIKEDASTSF
ncbi:hypothetical protein [Microcoleus sp. CZ3-B4]|uniref:hypothetical protein n=1 Tax=Microcoleus sp. CZ3-B4 TaxID=2818733 RepID=UPI002FD4ECCF